MPLKLYNFLKINGFINRTTLRPFGPELKAEGLSTGNPLFHFPITHYSTIPVFQHSNWGEAPKFELKGRRG